MRPRLVVLLILIGSLSGMSRAFAQDATAPAEGVEGAETISLQWQRLPDLPDELGVAGPFVGVHNDALLVAGGANFPRPVWENNKAWHDRIHVLTRTADGYRWRDGGRLPRPTGYGAAVSTPDGVLCMGGNDAKRTFRQVYLLRWNAAAGKVQRVDYPPLPKPCAYGQAALVGNTVYLAGGQADTGLESALKNFWSLKLNVPAAERAWRELKAWPGPSRALNLTVAQHNGQQRCVYVISGRRMNQDKAQFLKDVWEYSPRSGTWRRRADAPRSVMAGIAFPLPTGKLAVVGGADGSLFYRGDILKDKHPGFPKQSLVFDTRADKWSTGNPVPRNHVTTVPVIWNGRMIVASGEVRPRVRSRAVWSVGVKRD